MCGGAISCDGEGRAGSHVERVDVRYGTPSDNVPVAMCPLLACESSMGPSSSLKHIYAAPNYPNSPAMQQHSGPHAGNGLKQA